MELTGGFIMIGLAFISAIFVFSVIATLLEIYHPEDRLRADKVKEARLPIYSAPVSSVRAAPDHVMTCGRSSSG